MKDKRTIAIPIVIAILLSTLGIAYAHWSDMIKINGTVEMGSLTLGFVEVTCVDKEYLTFYPDPVPPGKDNARCICSLDEYVQDEHTLKEGYRKLWVKIEDGYPSYYCFATFIVENLGTVPAVFKTITLTAEAPLVAVEVAPGLWELKDTSKPGEPVVINVEIVNLIDVQLDFCEKTKAQIDTYIKQPAQECHEYKYHVEIVAENWDP